MLWQGVSDDVRIKLLKDTIPDASVDTYTVRQVRQVSVRKRKGKGFESSSLAGTNSKCHVCSKTVYAMEFIGAAGKAFHKACFKCAHCQVTLRADNYATVDETFYCMAHYDQLFKAGGGSYNFDSGTAGGGGGAAARSSNAAEGAPGTDATIAEDDDEQIQEQLAGGSSAPTTPVAQFQAEEKSKRTGSGRKLVSSLKGLLKKDKKKKAPPSAAATAAAPSHGHGSVPATPAASDAAAAAPEGRAHVGATLRAAPAQPTSYTQKKNGFSRKKMLTGYREKKTGGVKDMAMGMAAAAPEPAGGPNAFTTEAEKMMQARMQREDAGMLMYATATTRTHAVCLELILIQGPAQVSTSVTHTALPVPHCHCHPPHALPYARCHPIMLVQGTTNTRTRRLTWLQHRFQNRYEHLPRRMHHKHGHLAHDPAATVDRCNGPLALKSKKKKKKKKMAKMAKMENKNKNKNKKEVKRLKLKLQVKFKVPS